VGKTLRRVEKTIQEWERKYPHTWVLLVVTKEDGGEAVRESLIAQADDPEDIQRVRLSASVAAAILASSLSIT
jgi:hypothetical protein